MEPRPQCCSVLWAITGKDIFDRKCEKFLLRVIWHNRYLDLGNGSKTFGNHCNKPLIPWSVSSRFILGFDIVKTLVCDRFSLLWFNSGIDGLSRRKVFLLIGMLPSITVNSSTWVLHYAAVDYHHIFATNLAATGMPLPWNNKNWPFFGTIPKNNLTPLQCRLDLLLNPPVSHFCVTQRFSGSRAHNKWNKAFVDVTRLTPVIHSVWSSLAVVSCPDCVHLAIWTADCANV